MLVLSRKKNESVVINHDIIVTVVEVRGDIVRLGITAPKEVSIHRQEVFDAICADPNAKPLPTTVPYKEPELVQPPVAVVSESAEAKLVELGAHSE